MPPDPHEPSPRVVGSHKGAVRRHRATTMTDEVVTGRRVATSEVVSSLDFFW